jgi:hypothetical protein
VNDSKSNLSQRWFWRAVGFCLLLNYLCASASIAPAVTGLLALTDSAHAVIYSPTATGMSVVLRHGAICAQPHHHGFVARAITQLSDGNAQTEDHVIQFGASVAEVTAKSASILLPKILPLHGMAPAFGYCPSAPAIAHHFSSPRPPPGIGAALESVNSVNLLI